MNQKQIQLIKSGKCPFCEGKLVSQPTISDNYRKILCYNVRTIRLGGEKSRKLITKSIRCGFSAILCNGNIVASNEVEMLKRRI